MIKYILCILLLGLVCIPSQAQFSVGYGIGYFPTGMSSLYTEQEFFAKSNAADQLYGELIKNKPLLPIHHGLNVNWIIGGKKERKAHALLSWSNLHNSLYYERKHRTTGEITLYRKKSRANSLMFGGIFNLDSEFIKSWSLMGVLTNHSILNNNTGKKWEKVNDEFDMGIDVGLQTKISPSVDLNLHYTRCFFMFSEFNPSYLGLGLQLKLGK